MAVVGRLGGRKPVYYLAIDHMVMHAPSLKVGEGVNRYTIVEWYCPEDVPNVTESLPYDGVVAAKPVVELDAPPAHISAQTPSCQAKVVDCMLCSRIAGEP